MRRAVRHLMVPLATAAEEPSTYTTIWRRDSTTTPETLGPVPHVFYPWMCASASTSSEGRPRMSVLRRFRGKERGGYFQGAFRQTYTHVYRSATGRWGGDAQFLAGGWR